jgi:DNA repair protein RadC
LKGGEGGNKLAITSWSDDDRPREKMMQKGKEALSNAELIAILIGSGTAGYSAVDVGKLLLQGADNQLNKLTSMGIKDMCAVPGIGPAKAVTLMAAIELGKRRQAENQTDLQTLTSSRQVYDYLCPHLTDLDHERFFILLLNHRNVPIKLHRVSQGGASATVVDLKLIFKEIIKTDFVTGIILAHNHPSANAKPSAQDVSTTKKISELAKMFDIRLLDHIIVAGSEYYSFADHGTI